MTCKGICTRYKAKKPASGRGWYEEYQRCNPCALFIKWDGLNCPCCGMQLRGTPRNKDSKSQLKKKVERM